MYAGTPVRIRTSTSLTPAARSLLLLHGWGSRIEHMWPLLAFFDERVRVIAVDMPGHGESPPPPAAWGVEEHVRLVAELVEDQISGPFTIVGHSNGGRIALRMAASPDCPEGLEALVLVGPSGIRRAPSFTVHVKRLTARILKAPFSLLPRGLRESGLDWLKHSLVWRLLGSADYRALQGVMRDTFIRTVNHFVEEDLHKIDMPVLVLRGSEDTDVTRDQVDRLVAGLGDAGVHEIEGAGHYAQMERPDVVAAAVRMLWSDNAPGFTSDNAPDNVPENAPGITSEDSR